MVSLLLCPLNSDGIIDSSSLILHRSAGVKSPDTASRGTATPPPSSARSEDRYSTSGDLAARKERLRNTEVGSEAWMAERAFLPPSSQVSSKADSPPRSSQQSTTSDIEEHVLAHRISTDALLLDIIPLDHLRRRNEIELCEPSTLSLLVKELLRRPSTPLLPLRAPSRRTPLLVNENQSEVTIAIARSLSQMELAKILNSLLDPVQCLAPIRTPLATDQNLSFRALPANRPLLTITTNSFSPPSTTSIDISRRMATKLPNQSSSSSEW